MERGHGFWEEVIILGVLTFWTICPVELVSGKSVEKVKMEKERTKIYTCTTTKYYESRHSLVKSYHENGTAGWDIPHWDYDGSTVITNDFVRLTFDRSGQVGLLRNVEPVDMKNWEVQLQFRIHGRGNKNGSFGQNGITFWYTKNPVKEGPVFGGRDNFYGFAIVIQDSVDNNGDSHIYSLVNNETEKSFGSDPDHFKNPSSKCVRRIRNVEDDTWLKILYDRHTLNVWTDVEGEDEWTHCFTQEDIVLPTHYYIGVSGCTGDLSPDFHDVLAIKTFRVESENDDRDNEELIGDDPCKNMGVRNQVKSIIIVEEVEGGPGPTVLFMPLLIFMVMVALCVAGSQMYTSSRDDPNMPQRFH